MPKKGNPWAIVTIEDMESSIQCMFFGKVYEAAARRTGRRRRRADSRPGGEARRDRYACEPRKCRRADLGSRRMRRPVDDHAAAGGAWSANRMMQQLGQVLANHPGPCEVKLALMDDKGNAKVLTFGDRFRVRRDTSLFAEIKILFGPSSLPLG